MCFLTRKSQFTSVAFARKERILPWRGFLFFYYYYYYFFIHLSCSTRRAKQKQESNVLLFFPQNWIPRRFSENDLPCALSDCTFSVAPCHKLPLTRTVAEVRRAPLVSIASNRGKTAILGWRPTALLAGYWERLPDALASREVRPHGGDYRSGHCSWARRVTITVISVGGARMLERQKTFCNWETKRIYSERDVMSLEALCV